MNKFELSNDVLQTNQGQLNINQVLDAENHCCSDCGSMYFESVLVIKRISRLLTQAPNDQFMPIEVYRCANCKKIEDQYKHLIKEKLGGE